MRFIFIYFTSIQFNKKFKNNISPKFNSKDYSKLFISDQFNSKFNSKLWNWLDSIQQNIHSIWKCGYRSGLVASYSGRVQWQGRREQRCLCRWKKVASRVPTPTHSSSLYYCSWKHEEEGEVEMKDDETRPSKFGRGGAAFNFLSLCRQAGTCTVALQAGR